VDRGAEMKIAPPKEIYLQWYKSDPFLSVTWNKSKVHKDDVKYIRDNSTQITLEKVEEFHEYLVKRGISLEEQNWEAFDIFTAWLEELEEIDE
jgi:hypothetical protein